MATRKSVDQILDGAADILEKHGWVTETCYDSDKGGFCALGAIAKATFPKLPNSRTHERAYVTENDQYEDGTPVDPRHLEAVQFLARRISGNPRDTSNDVVSSFNDNLDSGVVDGAWRNDKCVYVFDEKTRYKSSSKVVQKLRNAAKAYRKQQAGSSSTTNTRSSRSKNATEKRAA